MNRDDMADELRISDDISIPLAEIEFTAVRSRGAGGQNVNKVASAVQLRFDIRASGALPGNVRQRLLDLGDRRVSSDGVLIIKAQEFRTQARNRAAALERLRHLVATAAVEQKPRIATRPGKRIRQKQVDDKRRRGELKRNRGKISEE